MIPRVSAFVVLTALLAGCGESVSGARSALAGAGCAEGSALIELGDGFIRSLCGCGPAAVDPVAAPDTFTCAVGRGTVVIFDAAGTILQHEVLFEDGPAELPGSPVLGGDPEAVLVRHAVTLDVAGTYLFKDAFQQGIPGRIVVR